jgi:mannose-6-phosphate isomerase-like protein (cupin superfamily)
VTPELRPYAKLRQEIDYIAPDGSEIRLLSQTPGGGICHCTLPADRTSQAVKHRSVEELWYVLSGTGDFWNPPQAGGKELQLEPGVSLSIDPGTPFQFKTTGHAPLEILIVTVPRWPGPDEAVRAEDHWPTN